MRVRVCMLALVVHLALQISIQNAQHCVQCVIGIRMYSDINVFYCCGRRCPTDTSFFHLLLFPNFLFAPLCPYYNLSLFARLSATVHNMIFARIARRGTARLPIDKLIYVVNTV